jgi:hypothetical protein
VKSNLRRFIGWLAAWTNSMRPWRQRWSQSELLRVDHRHPGRCVKTLK